MVVRIETWNMENFARPGALDGGPTIDAAYNAKLASLADAITALDPDVLAVQEVGDPAALQDLANKLAGYAHVATADPDGRDVRVGYLSKLSPACGRSPPSPPRYAPSRSTTPPPPRVRWVAPRSSPASPPPAATPSTWSPATSSRSCSPFPVVRSAPATRPCAPATAPTPSYRRAAEAVTVRDTATQLLTGRVSSGRSSCWVTTTTAPTPPPPRSCPARPARRSAPAATRPPTRATAPRLWNLSPHIQPPANRCSRIYRGDPELIDHILASHLVTHHVGDGDVTAGIPTARLRFDHG